MTPSFIGRCCNHCVWLSQEPGHHHRWDSFLQHPRQQRLQGILLPHQGTATCTRMHRRGDCKNSGQLNCWCQTRLLQFSTAWHHHLEHQLNPACHQHAGSSGHRHWKTRSHYTGLGEIALASSPVAHHLQSRSHNLQNTSFKKKQALSLGVAVLPSCTKNTPIEFFISSTRWCSQDCSQVALFVLQRRKFGTVFRTTWPDFFSVIRQFQTTT